MSKMIEIGKCVYIVELYTKSKSLERESSTMWEDNIL